MPKQKSEEVPVLVLFVVPGRGLAEVQVHALPGGQVAGAVFLERLQPTLNRLDRLARGGHTMSRTRENGE